MVKSSELKKGDVKNQKLCGRHVVIFRGEDGKPYCLDAYCAHMGANLGEGGKVKHERCIECPFHGWTFDGATGKCVNSAVLDTKHATCYRYNDFETFECKDGS